MSGWLMRLLLDFITLGMKFRWHWTFKKCWGDLILNLLWDRMENDFVSLPTIIVSLLYIISDWHVTHLYIFCTLVFLLGLGQVCDLWSAACSFFNHLFIIFNAIYYIFFIHYGLTFFVIVFSLIGKWKYFRILVL